MSREQIAENGQGAYLPIGSVVMWGGDAGKIPIGWLVCDGGIYSKKNYPALAEMIGTNFGTPDASDLDFYVPDLRGRFVRGVDSDAGRDPDRESRLDMRSKKVVGGKVGSVQGDEFRSHHHKYEHPLGTEHSNKSFYSGKYWEPGTRETEDTGGKETRPINAYLYFIIKAK